VNIKTYLGALALALISGGVPGVASAGGMALSTRGVRATARGGAFVAGTDDLSAMWMNPAGLANSAGGDSKMGILFDAALVSQSGEYTRVDSGMNEQATVSNQFGGLPVPSMAAGFDLGDKGVIGAAIYAPYAGLMKFDEDGPQRYSLIDMSKSVQVTISVGIGWKLGEHVRVGATLQNWVSSLSQTVMASGCPGETVCAPEDPDFDSLVQVDQNDLFNPSGSLGVQADAGKKVTFGASFQLPVHIAGDVTLRTRLPNSGFYDGATVSGDQAGFDTTLPAIIRGGIEVRPTPLWRIEVAGDMELWKEHESIDVTPHEIRIENAAGVGTYELGPMSVPRHYKNSYSGSLGVEGQPMKSTPLRVLAGYTYETAAAEDAYLSVLTFDGAKHLGSVGVGYTLKGKYTLDAVFAYAKVEDRTVTPDEGLSPQQNPVRDPNDPPLVTYVNWGDYKSSWLVAGLAFRAAF
jgi:long-chain fatty acid transport protein